MLAASHDPLGILTSTAFVMTQAASVTIDADAIERLADSLVRDGTEPPAWDATLHFQGSGPDGIAQTAGWVLVLDALNFCIWGGEHGGDPDDRWRVTWQGTTYNGYAALAAALSRAVEEGVDVWDPDWLSQVSASELQHILRPTAGSPEIPLFAARLRNLHELGHGLQALQSPAGEARGLHAVQRLIEGANGSAIQLVRDVVARFPSFDDTATWDDRESGTPTIIRFYKRAQIFVADLRSAVGSATGSATVEPFHDREALTAFADYKVPQVLRQFGILVYAPDLGARIARRELLPAGSREEIEIRAATIQACERIRLALAGQGRKIAAYEIDWLLWNAGQSLPQGTEPYHRTLTIFY